MPCEGLILSNANGTQVNPVMRSRLTYKKIIADQAAEIADQRGQIERLTKQVARLKDKVASAERLSKHERRAGKKLDQKPEL